MARNKNKTKLPDKLNTDIMEDSIDDIGPTDTVESKPIENKSPEVLSNVATSKNIMKEDNLPADFLPTPASIKNLFSKNKEENRKLNDFRAIMQWFGISTKDTKDINKLVLLGLSFREYNLLDIEFGNKVLKEVNALAHHEVPNDVKVIMQRYGVTTTLLKDKGSLYALEASAISSAKTSVGKALIKKEFELLAGFLATLLS